MQITDYITSINRNIANRTSNDIKYIVIHYVGATGGAMDNAKFFKSVNRNSSAHYFVGHNGEIVRCVNDKDIAWHCGAKTYKHNECRNANSIGIELCCRKNPNGTWRFEDKTVDSAITLTKELMAKYNISSANVIRHHDVTGKNCPEPFVRDVSAWNNFKSKLNKKEEVINTPSTNTNGLTPITGKSIATAEQLASYLISKNANTKSYALEYAKLFIQEGIAENIRGDFAFCQSCIETGNFTFNGSAVTLYQNNFCGMGVTSRGMKGNSFPTPQIGIRAQIQHLKAYANKLPLNNACVDPRFKYVTRGCAEYIEWLGIQENPQKKGWAAGEGYGKKLLNVYNNVLKTNVTVKPSNPTSTSTPQLKYKVEDKVNYTSYYASSVSSIDKAVIKSGSGTITRVLTNGVRNPYLIDNGKIGWCNDGDISGYVGEVNTPNVPKPKFPYIVKIIANALNIRKEPNSDGTVVGQIKDKGKYTIVDEKNGYGKLKSGAGWIHLELAERV